MVSGVQRIADAFHSVAGHSLLGACVGLGAGVALNLYHYLCFHRVNSQGTQIFHNRVVVFLGGAPNQAVGILAAANIDLTAGNLEGHSLIIHQAGDAAGSRQGDAVIDLAVGIGGHGQGCGGDGQLAVLSSGQQISAILGYLLLRLGDTAKGHGVLAHVLAAAASSDVLEHSFRFGAGVAAQDLGGAVVNNGTRSGGQGNVLVVQEGDHLRFRIHRGLLLAGFHRGVASNVDGVFHDHVSKGHVLHDLVLDAFNGGAGTHTVGPEVLDGVGEVGAGYVMYIVHAVACDLLTNFREAFVFVGELIAGILVFGGDFACDCKNIRVVDPDAFRHGRLVARLLLAVLIVVNGVFELLCLAGVLLIVDVQDILVLGNGQLALIHADKVVAANFYYFVFRFDDIPKLPAVSDFCPSHGIAGVRIQIVHRIGPIRADVAGVISLILAYRLGEGNGRTGKALVVVPAGKGVCMAVDRLRCRADRGIAGNADCRVCLNAALADHIADLRKVRSGFAPEQELHIDDVLADHRYRAVNVMVRVCAVMPGHLVGHDHNAQNIAVLDLVAVRALQPCPVGIRDHPSVAGQLIALGASLEDGQVRAGDNAELRRILSVASAAPHRVRHIHGAVAVMVAPLRGVVGEGIGQGVHQVIELRLIHIIPCAEDRVISPAVDRRHDLGAVFHIGPAAEHRVGIQCQEGLGIVQVGIADSHLIDAPEGLGLSGAVAGLVEGCFRPRRQQGVVGSPIDRGNKALAVRRIGPAAERRVELPIVHDIRFRSAQVPGADGGIFLTLEGLWRCTLVSAQVEAGFYQLCQHGVVGSPIGRGNSLRAVRRIGPALEHIIFGVHRKGVLRILQVVLLYILAVLAPERQWGPGALAVLIEGSNRAEGIQLGVGPDIDGAKGGRSLCG